MAAGRGWREPRWGLIRLGYQARSASVARVDGATRVAKAVERLRSLAPELDRLFESQSPAPAAGLSDAALAALEQRLGPLPDDYRAFLRIADGWSGLRGGIHFFSSNELLAESVQGRHRRTGTSACVLAHTDENLAIFLLHGQGERRFLWVLEGRTVGEAMSFSELLERYALELGDLVA